MNTETNTTATAYTVRLPGIFINDAEDGWLADFVNGDNAESVMISALESGSIVRAGRSGGFYVDVQLNADMLCWLRTEAWWRWEQAYEPGDADFNREMRRHRTAALKVMHRIDALLGYTPDPIGRGISGPEWRKTIAR